jgi:hypothetical protein
MGFAKSDITRDACMLKGAFARKGYDWWWHSFTGRDVETGEEKAFFVEFYACNPALGRNKPILGQLPENKKAGRRPSYLCVKAGAWGEDAGQIHRFFAWKDVKMKAPFFLTAQDCFLSETQTWGQVEVTEEEAAAHPEYMCQPGKMTWELRMEKRVPFNVGYGAGWLLRTIHAFEMYWHVEGMKTVYEGKVWWNGREYAVMPEQSYGYADKNWGADFTSPWLWLSSNHLKSKLTGKVLNDSAFVIGGGSPKVFGISLYRKLLGAFYYEGQEFEFNFSKFWTLSRTKFDCRETKDEIIWRVRQENCNAIMQAQIRCKKRDMILINYEAPDGTRWHKRLWNGGNGVGRIRLYKKEGIYRTLVDDISVRNAGCEYGEMIR